MAQRPPCEPHPATFCPTFLGSSTNSGPVEASVLHGEGTGAATESQRMKTEDACPEEDDDGSLKTVIFVLQNCSFAKLWFAMWKQTWIYLLECQI